MVHVKAHIYLAAVQLGELSLVQAVGVVVGGEADHCVFQLPGLLQLPQKLLQGQVQLHLAGQVGPGPLAVGQVGDLLPVPGGHGVAHEGVVEVAAHRHVVGVEGLAADVLRPCDLHHLQVGFRPDLGDLEPVAQALVVVTQVGVRPIPVVVAIGVVVIGPGGVALPPELVAHGKEHGVVGRLGHGPHSWLGDEGGGGGVLSVQGGHPPQGVVEIFENKPFMGELVEGGGELRVHSEPGKSLGGEPDEVFPREIAGIRILTGGFHLGKILVHGF